MPDITTAGMSASAEGALPEFAWALRSHVGAVRDGNEDCVGAYTPRADDEDAFRGPVFVVADGMGGHAAGEVASRLAVSTAISSWVTSSTGAPHQALRGAVRSANAAVFGASLDEETRGMGTTLVAVALAGDQAIVAHVGDSRAYLVRGGVCTQMTADHSRVAELQRAGLISAEQAEHHPARSQLTRSLGQEPAVQVDVSRRRIERGDVIVMCSDGLWGLMKKREIAEAASGSAEDAAGGLLALALERGAPDNVTVVVLKITAEPTEYELKPLQRWSPFSRPSSRNKAGRKKKAGAGQ